jgi:hypothetical protein
MPTEQELRATLERIAHALESVQVPWAIGGSFTSTMYGEPRATNDVDVIANLRAAHVEPFVRELGGDFYADEVAIRQAVTERDSFNVIDERSFLKVDVFVPSPGPLGEGQLVRRRAYSMSDAGPMIFVLSPEDTILQKLRWFELTNRTSDRQWRDLVSVARFNRDLDLTYLREVAASSELSDLLDRALDEARRQVPSR